MPLLIIAMVAGILTNIFDKEEVKKVKKPAFSAVAQQPANSFVINTLKHEESCETDKSSCCSSTSSEKKKFSLLVAMRYAFGTLLGDIAKPLFWGLILGTLITVAIPDNLVELLSDNSWLSYLLVIIIAVPMYVCATASLPIAAGLMLSGVSAGAAFVFLSAGPATNTVTIGVVKKMLGIKSLIIYLGSIIVGSILFGLGLDYIFDTSDVDLTTLIDMDKEGSIIATLSSLLLWGFVLFYTIKPYIDKK